MNIKDIVIEIATYLNLYAKLMLSSTCETIKQYLCEGLVFEEETLDYFTDIALTRRFNKIMLKIYDVHNYNDSLRTNIKRATWYINDDYYMTKMLSKCGTIKINKETLREHKKLLKYINIDSCTT